MNYFPSPPNSPYLESFSITHQQSDHVVCGACNKSLGSDWFCSECHRKCNTCNRFLGQDEYCTRCWSFDPVNQQFSRKLNKFYYLQFYQQQQQQQLTGLPSPSNSTGSISSSGPKLLTKPFTWKN